MIFTARVTGGLKTLLLLLLWSLVLSSPNSVSAQSTFDFVNYVPGVLDAPVFDASGNRLAGSNYVAMLYGGPIVDSLTPAKDYPSRQIMVPTPFSLMPFGQSGYFDYDRLVAIFTVSPMGFAWLQVRAWDARLGASYETVAALGIGGYGESTVFHALGGDPGGGVPTLPGLLIGLESFSLRAVVPEPNPTLLFFLGLPWLLWRCWRRR